MSRYHPARCLASAALASVVLPLVLSCSRGPTSTAGEKGEPDQSAPDSPDARHQKAIAEQTEAIRLDPEKANDRGELPHHLRARAYAEAGNLDRAIADFTEAIRLYPLVKPPYLAARLAEAYYGRGESY